jgi:threonine-phosphate decarboxylase
MINGHGNDLHNYDIEIVADFSTSIAKAFTKELLITQLQRKIKNINNYPHPDALPLKIAIAKYHKLNIENIIACNGSTEAFYLIAQCYSGSKTFIHVPSFSEYEDACTIHDHEISFGTVPKNTASFNMLWLGNPNNPDGKTLNKAEIEEFCSENPNTIFVIDEAFAGLCTGFQSAIPLINKYNNLIITRSLTKAFIVPGLRLGYIIANSQTAQKLSKKLIPWNVNSLAIEAGVLIMNNYDYLSPDEKELSFTSKKLQKDLTKLDGLKVFPSNCNYFLLELKSGSAAELKKYMIENHGILIRDASNFRGLNSGFFRISVRSKQHNQLLLHALKEWLSIK